MHLSTGILKSSLPAFIFFLLIQTSIAQNRPGAAFSPTDSIKVETLLSQMTLDEKVGQLSLFASGWEVTGPAMNTRYKQLIRDGKVGAILNASTPDYVKKLQKMAVEESRLKIPLLFGYDVIHGYRTIFPIPLGQAASWDLDAIEKADRIAAGEASAEGICWTFAPMVDISRDPRWGRVSEGAGEDPFLGSRIAEARVRGFQGTGYEDGRHILACAKHFAAYGDPMAGRDYNVVDISPASLYEYYLPPYKACVDAGVATVMTSFNEINGMPSTCNSWLLTDLLRKEWGFNGFVVTDWTSINELVEHGVAEDLKSAAELSLNAGVDMDMMGSTFLDYLPGLVKENKVKISDIDRAVRYILRAKIQVGLFDDPYRFCNQQREQSEIMTKESLEFARKLVSESCVLLKNDNRTLPVPQRVRTLAVIGPLGDAKKEMLGNWNAAGDWKNCITLLEGIRNKCKGSVNVSFEKGCNINDKDLSGIEAAVKLAQKADYVILALGESGEMSGEAASRSDIDLPGVQNQLADAVINSGKPTAVVLFNGRPLSISHLEAIAPAILETWFGGTQAGNGITDVLFGDVNPSGKITMSFPRNTGQIPVFYSRKNTGRPFKSDQPDEKYVSRYLDCPVTPLYPFGFGLSYTNFSYSGIKALVKGNEITVSASVTNTGERDGEEIVQLYIQDKVGSITRPLKELKGFKKLLIRKGQTVQVTFTLSADDLSFYHPDLKKYWEPGEFNAFVGGSSATVISATFRL
ncbi:MAG: beta-glucosidase BglX [Bacteroidetes bacterium]|nr:beta-glucosidase BglX [Bacteroidota bacterium]